MKAAVVLAVAGLAAAQIPDISNIPQCAISCLLPAITKTGCGLTDFQCICGKFSQLQSESEPCVKDKCSPEDLQKSLDAAKQLCPGSGAGSSTSAGSSSAPASSSAPTSSSAPATSSAPASSTGAASSSSPAHNTTTSAAASSSSGAPASSSSSHASGGSSSTTTSGGSTPTTPAGSGAGNQVAGVLAAIGAAVFAL